VSDSVLASLQDRVLTLTLNRPDKLNALVPDMRPGFEEALRLARTPEAKVVVLRGAGRAFCAGGDIGWIQDARAHGRWAELHSVLDLGVEVAHGLATLDKPVIAVIHGPCAGAGLSLALAADLRIATPEAKFSMAFVKIGLHPDWGGSVLLQRLVNASIAAELMLGGDPFDAGRARDLGLVNQIVDAEVLEDVVKVTAHRFTQGPSQAYARIKASLLRNGGLDPERLKALLKAEGDQMRAAMESPEAEEGLRAFLEKRAPVFP
jgi:2-(1,2-epoxy-1,2-dihydrophenyl)acetyl-CoA isomerase